MEFEEIKRRNEAICLWMGGEFKTDLPYTFTKSGWVNTPVDRLEIVQSHQFRYNSSWDWLMPVVEKIVSIDRTIHKIGRYTVNITGNATAITDHDNKEEGRVLADYFNLVNFDVPNFMLKAAWLTVSDFCLNLKK